MSEFNSYKITHLKGTLGDNATEYWTEEDWEKWRAHVAELKATGEYLKPVELTYHFKPNPLFDNSAGDQPYESHGIIFPTE